MRASFHLTDLLAVTALACVVVLPGLGQQRDVDPHEIRHAEIIREMAVNGDYLMPRLLGQPYYHKTPVMHAAAALITRWSESPSLLVARLPSAMASILCVLATWWVGLLLLDRGSAFASACVLLAVPGFTMLARQARPDMVFCMAVMVSCVAILYAMRARGAAAAGFLVMAGVAAGIGALSKGPYGLIFPVLFAVLAPIGRDDLERPRMSWTAFVLGVCLVVAAWAVPLYLRDHGQYLHELLSAVGLDMGGGEHGKPFAAYRWLLLMMPLTLLLPVALSDARRQGFSGLLAVGLAIALVILVVPKKRSHYMAPAAPFLALAVARSLTDRWRNAHVWLRAAVCGMLGLFMLSSPLWYAVLLPARQPADDSRLLVARQAAEAIEPGAAIYCERSLVEPLAWVARRTEGIQPLQRKPEALARVLGAAAPGSLLIIEEKRFNRLRELNAAPASDHSQSLRLGGDTLLVLRLKKP